MNILKFIFFLCVLVTTYLILYKLFVKKFVNKMNSVQAEKESRIDLIKNINIKKIVLSVFLGACLFIGGIINYQKISIAIMFLCIGMILVVAIIKKKTSTAKAVKAKRGVYPRMNSRRESETLCRPPRMWTVSIGSP